MKRRTFTLPRGTQLTGDIIKKLIEKHKKYIDDYARLESYFDNDPKINRKKPNDIVVYHNFARYITTILCNIKPQKAWTFLQFLMFIKAKPSLTSTLK